MREKVCSYRYYGEIVCKGLVGVLERLSSMMLMEYTNCKLLSGCLVRRQITFSHERPTKAGEAQRKAEAGKRGIAQPDRASATKTDPAQGGVGHGYWHIPVLRRADFLRKVGRARRRSTTLPASNAALCLDLRTALHQLRPLPQRIWVGPKTLDKSSETHHHRFNRAKAYDPKCFKEAADAFEDSAVRLRNVESPAAGPLMADLLSVAKQNAVVSKLLASQQLNVGSSPARAFLLNTNSSRICQFRNL